MNDYINKIFQSKSVNETQESLSKMCMDIEKKKEDLRIMVGERYRDIIEAADTISEMEVNAQTIYKNILTMEDLCSSLHERGLIGFKTKKILNNPRLQKNKLEYSFAVQVKLLIDIPEILWGLIERKKHLDASQLLLLSNQVQTSLQLTPDMNDLIEHFPVISRQYLSIAQFHSTLMKSCKSSLQKETEDSDLIVKSLASVILIDDMSIESSFSLFLDYRKAFIIFMLKSDPKMTVKNQLQQFVKYVIISLYFIYFSYISEQGDSRLVNSLLNVCHEESSPYSSPIRLLQESSLGFGFLPKSISEFKPKFQFSFSDLPESLVKNRISNWLENIKDEVKNSIQNILTYASNIKSLAATRDNIWQTQQNLILQCSFESENVKKICKDYSPWTFFINDLATAKAKNLITKEVRVIVSSVTEIIEEYIKEINSNPKLCKEEGDLSKYLWIDSSFDLPQQSEEKPKEKIGLFFRIRGFTKKVQTVFKLMNSKLNQVLKDVSEYALSDSFSENLASDVEATCKAYEEILEFMQTITLESMNVLVENLKLNADVNLKSQDEFFGTLKSHEDVNENLLCASSAATSFVIRVLRGAPIACPHLNLSACATKYLKESLSKERMNELERKPDTAPNTKSWQDLIELFGKASDVVTLNLMRSFVRLFANLFRQDFENIFSDDSSEKLLLLFLSWETMKIEEVSESGVHESSLRIPAQTSAPLANFLTHVVSALNLLCPHTFSKQCHSEFVCELCESIVSVYESVLSNYSKLNQSVCIQLIFDIKLFHNLFLPRENKELNDRTAALIKKLESGMDPFDLNVFLPLINTKIKIASQRFIVLYGAIIPRGKQPLTTRDTSTSSNFATLPIVANESIPRFSSVPIPLSMQYHKQNIAKNPALFLTEETDSKENGNLSTSKSTPSLFSVMSSSWFGEYLN